MSRPFLGISKWRIRSLKEQESLLAHHFYQLMHTIAEHNIPLTTLFFPRLAKDPEYLFGKINFLLKDISYERFARAFEKISRPELIHNFSATFEAELNPSEMSA